MLKTLFVGLVGLVVTAAAMPHRRAVGSTIYAYGTDIDGLALQSTSNGSIYVTSAASSSLYDVTVSMTNSSTPWVATLTNNGTSLTGYDFYIVPTADALDPIGFVSPGASAPDGAVTTGFVHFGSAVEYNDGTTYLSQFWARAVANSTNTWEILWNSDNDSADDLETITLKTLAPSS